MRAFFILGLLISQVAWAKVLRNEAIRLRRDHYDIKEACAYMGHTETLLVDPQGLGHLDCMGTLVSATDFCRKKLHDLASPALEDVPTRGVTRGIVEANTKMITCESASQVDVSMECEKKDPNNFCLSSTYGCGELKKIFAAELDIEHQAIIQADKGRRLNCYFSFKAPESDQSLKSAL